MIHALSDGYSIFSYGVKSKTNTRNSTIYSARTHGFAHVSQLIILPFHGIDQFGNTELFCEHGVRIAIEQTCVAEYIFNLYHSTMFSLTM